MLMSRWYSKTWAPTWSNLVLVSHGSLKLSSPQEQGPSLSKREAGEVLGRGREGERRFMRE